MSTKPNPDPTKENPMATAKPEGEGLVTHDEQERLTPLSFSPRPRLYPRPPKGLERIYTTRPVPPPGEPEAAAETLAQYNLLQTYLRGTRPGTYGHLDGVTSELLQAAVKFVEMWLEVRSGPDDDEWREKEVTNGWENNGLFYRKVMMMAVKCLERVCFDAGGELSRVQKMLEDEFDEEYARRF